MVGLSPLGKLTFALAALQHKTGGIMAIPYKQFIEEMTESMNKALAEMPDDETRQAVLDAFSRQMFCGPVDEEKE